MATICSVSAEYYKVPLDEVLVDAVHGDHTHFELILCRLVTDDGTEGVGYTYTGGFGGRAVVCMLQHDLLPFLVGKDADCIESLWHQLQWRVHYVARGGIASFAISAVDIALWDLRGKRSGMPLWKMAGGRARTANVYAGGIDLHYPLERLLDNTRRYLDAGFTSVKIKVGQKRLRDDFERAVKVREIIGDRGAFMVDANMSWSIEKAVRAGRFFREETDALWLEEPIIPDDYQGHARVQSESGMAVGTGENYHTLYEFRLAMELGQISYPIPDASNIGGITGFLAVAAMAYAKNLPVCSHGMQELHVSLLAGISNPGWVEAHSFPIDRYTTRPLVLENGMAVAPDTPGTGVEFRMDLLEPFADG